MRRTVARAQALMSMPISAMGWSATCGRIDAGGIGLDAFQQGDRHPQLSFAAARALGVVLHCHPSHSGMGGWRRRQGCKGNQYSVKRVTPEACHQCRCRVIHGTTLTNGLAMAPTEDCSSHASAFTLTDQLCFWRAVAWPHVPADQGEEGPVHADSRAEILTPIHVTKH